jgi:hypothetical protein
VYRVRLKDSEGFLVSNEVIAETFAAVSDFKLKLAVGGKSA